MSEAIVLCGVDGRKVAVISTPCVIRCAVRTEVGPPTWFTLVGHLMCLCQHVPVRPTCSSVLLEELQSFPELLPLPAPPSST